MSRLTGLHKSEPGFEGGWDRCQAEDERFNSSLEAPGEGRPRPGLVLSCCPLWQWPSRKRARSGSANNEGGNPLKRTLFVSLRQLSVGSANKVGGEQPEPGMSKSCEAVSVQEMMCDVRRISHVSTGPGTRSVLKMG